MYFIWEKNKCTLYILQILTDLMRIFDMQNFQLQNMYVVTIHKNLKVKEYFSRWFVHTASIKNWLLF